MYESYMGIPQMKEFWEELSARHRANTANKDDEVLYKNLGNALKHLSLDPKYPGLRSHEIEALTVRYGMKVFESYLENNKPAAGRIFWVYGPGLSSITVIGIEPHPNDKSNAYKKITLSKMEQK